MPGDRRDRPKSAIAGLEVGQSIAQEHSYNALGGRQAYGGQRRGQSAFPRLAGGTIPFIRRYSTICP